MKQQKSVFYSAKQLKQIKKRSLKKDIWFNIPGYDNKYQITPQGKVRNSKGKLLYTGVSKRGYLRTSLYHKNKRTGPTIHKLVMITFYGINPADIGLSTDHISKNKLDNSFWNLRAISQRANNLHSYSGVGNASEYPGVVISPTDYKWRAVITIHRKTLVLIETNDEKEAARAYKKACKAIEKGKKVVIYRRSSRSINIKGLKVKVIRLPRQIRSK